MKLRERVTFWRESRKRVDSTGAIQPSSRFLARAMVRPFARAASAPGAGPLGVVEMGPGTGSVTRALALCMRPVDRLDCYEISGEFAAFLERRIAHDPIYAPLRDRIVVHRAAAESARLPAPADFVLCSLPLNNFDPDQAEAIFTTGRRLVDGDGWFTYFEYPMLPRLVALTAGAEERARLRAVAAVKRSWSRHRRESAVVFANLPPARAIHLRFG